MAHLKAVHSNKHRHYSSASNKAFINTSYSNKSQHLKPRCLHGMIIEEETVVGSEVTATGTGEAVEGEEDITEGLRGAADQGAHRGEVESEIDEVLSSRTTQVTQLYCLTKYIAFSADHGRDDRRDRDLKRDDRDRRDHGSRDKRYPGRSEHGRERNGEPVRDRVERRDRDGDREHDIPPPRRDTDRGRGLTAERGDSLPPPSAPGSNSNGRHQDDHGHEREEGEEGEDAPMEDAVDDDEAAMRAMMGFGGFDTTKVRLSFYFIPMPA